MPKIAAPDAAKFGPRLSDALAAFAFDEKPSLRAGFSLPIHRPENASNPADCNCPPESTHSSASSKRRRRGRREPYHYRDQDPRRIKTGRLAVGWNEKRPVLDKARRARALTFDQVREMTNAHAFADHIGRPCNALLTVTWRFSRLWSKSNACWSRLQTQLLNFAIKWLRQRDIETAFVWARETAPGKGDHTHVAIHIGTNPVAVREGLIAALMAKFKFFDEEGVDISYGKYGARTKKMRAGTLRYITKGLDRQMFRYNPFNGWATEQISDALGIGHRGEQGIVMIKRAGGSQNIGPAARKAAGWEEVREIPKLYNLLHPTNGSDHPRLRAGRVTDA